MADQLPYKAWFGIGITICLVAFVCTLPLAFDWVQRSNQVAYLTWRANNALGYSPPEPPSAELTACSKTFAIVYLACWILILSSLYLFSPWSRALVLLAMIALPLIRIGYRYVWKWKTYDPALKQAVIEEQVSTLAMFTAAVVISAMISFTQYAGYLLVGEESTVLTDSLQQAWRLTIASAVLLVIVGGIFYWRQTKASDREVELLPNEQVTDV
jgi:hypothetical protein